MCVFYLLLARECGQWTVWESLLVCRLEFVDICSSGCAAGLAHLLYSLTVENN